MDSNRGGLLASLAEESAEKSHFTLTLEKSF
jgi:hypothetical protein